jgi:hypothetical protein
VTCGLPHVAISPLYGAGLVQAGGGTNTDGPETLAEQRGGEHGPIICTSLDR